MRCNLCSSSQFQLKFSLKEYSFYRCINCGFVCVSPVPPPEVIKKIYQQEDFYSEGMKRAGGPEIYRRLKVIEKFTKRGRMLDIGCAAGFFLNLANRNGWETMGIEVSEHNANHAIRTFGLQVLKKPLEETSLPAASFDVITLWGVIEHVSDPVGFLRKVVALLKNDGTIAIATNNIDGWMGKLMKQNFPFITYPEHLCLFNTNTVKKLLNLCGLKPVQLDTNDVITPQKAIRGLSKMFIKLTPCVNSRFLSKFFTMLVVISQPMLWFLGKCHYGSEMEIYAKKIEKKG